MTVNTYTGVRTNAELIEQVYELGHLDDAWRVLDSTYSNGKFWARRRPPRLVTVDIDPDKPAQILGDGTRLPFADATFDATITDGPYKLNGRPTDAVDQPYGVHRWESREGRHQLLVGLLAEAARVTVPGGRCFAKCQPQVNGGRLWFQQRILSDAGEAAGLDLVDELYMASGRAQPLRAPCLACGAKLMRRSTGVWGRVVSSKASEDEQAAAFVCDAGGAHQPGDLSPQQHSNSNMSILLIFIKLPPSPPKGEAADTLF